VQEAGDEQTWIGNFAHNCVLNWKGGKKTIPFGLTTNTSIFFMALSTCTHCAFVTTFKALEALYFCREIVLQYPRHMHINGNSIGCSCTKLPKINYPMNLIL
jgi:hypothetical protein